MSHVDDVREGGWWPLQHHDPAFHVSDRRHMGAVRIHPAEGTNDSPGRQTYGDLSGGLLTKLARDGDREHLHTWHMTGAGVVNRRDGGTRVVGAPAQGWYLVRSEPYVADDRFRPHNPPAPSWSRFVPAQGWTATVTASTEEQSQQEELHPDFWGLIAVNKAGDPEIGSPVYDLTDANEPDPARFARLQSAWTVLNLDPGGCSITGRALAQNVGRGGRKDGGPGYWMLCDHDHREVGIGSGATGRPGPITLGDGACVHGLGTDADGRRLVPGHLDTRHLVIWPGLADGPWMFEPEGFQPVQPDGDYWLRGHIRFDREQFHNVCGNAYAGKWSVEVAVPFFIDRQPPPPDPPPPPPPPPWDWPPPPPPPQPPPGGDPPPPIGDPPPPQPPPGDGPIGYLPDYTRRTGDPITPVRDLLQGGGILGGGVLRDSTTPVRDLLQSGAFGGGVLREQRVNFPLPVTSTALYFKAGASLDGELAQPGQECYRKSPAVGQIAAVAPGSGQWCGFTTQAEATDYDHATAAGSLVVLPAGVRVQDYVEGSAAAPDSVLRFTFPPDYSEAFYGDADRTTSEGIGEGVRVYYSAADNDLKFTYTDSTGADVSSLLLGALGGGASGDVTGPASATDNEVPRFNGTGGKDIQTSGVIIDDATKMTGVLAYGLTDNGSATRPSGITTGSLWRDGVNLYFYDGSTDNLIGTGAAGDVVGPASATDNRLCRFDGGTGKLIQTSAATLSDAGSLAGINAFEMTTLGVRPTFPVTGEGLWWDGTDIYWYDGVDDVAITSTHPLTLGGTGATTASGARTNLGLAIGTDVQAYDAQLADIAGISWAQGDILYHNGTNLVALTAGTSGQYLKTQGAAANPTWATVNAAPSVTDKQILYGNGTTLTAGSFTTALDYILGASGEGAVVRSGSSYSAKGTLSNSFLGAASGGTIDFLQNIKLSKALGGGAAVVNEFEQTGLSTTATMRFVLDAQPNTSFTTGAANTLDFHASGAVVSRTGIINDGASGWDVWLASSATTVKAWYDASADKMQFETPLIMKESAAPGTPSTGYGVWYVNSTTSSPSFKNDAGTVYGMYPTGSSPGSASGWSDSTAQSWANDLLTALTSTGLLV